MHQTLVSFSPFRVVAAAIVIVISLPSGGIAMAQQPLPFRPIGSASAVDQTASEMRRQASTGIRQVAMQSGQPGGFSLPGDSLPGDTGLGPAPFSPPPQSNPMPNSFPNDSFQNGNSQNNARTLPQPNAFPADVIGGNPTFAPNRIGPPPSDYAPVAPPQLSNGGFATMSNCALITAPSGYSAMSPYAGYGGSCGTGPVGYATPATYIPPPAQIASPAAIPAGPAPGFASPGLPQQPARVGPAGALVDFGQGVNPVTVGPGLWGQPVAYVPGQSFRNWLRYFSF